MPSTNTPHLGDRYDRLWPRVLKANGKRVCLRTLASPNCAWNTASRLRSNGLPKGVVLEVVGSKLYGRVA
jgi:hypothetical protein